MRSGLSQRLWLCVLAVAVSFSQANAEHAPPPAEAATTYPSFDQHPAEQVAIAAEPYNTPDKASVFRFKFAQYGFMPIRIIVTNNGDKPISLIDARINFITAANDRIPAATPEEVERRIGVKRPDGGYKLPGPLPRIGNKSGTKNKEVDDDFHTFEYSAIAVEAHTTRAGFLFYDVDGIANPLAGAKISLRMLRNAEGKELFYFEIPLDKFAHGNAAN